jgi:hypothetical protein
MNVLAAETADGLLVLVVAAFVCILWSWYGGFMGGRTLLSAFGLRSLFGCRRTEPNGTDGD